MSDIVKKGSYGVVTFAADIATKKLDCEETFKREVSIMRALQRLPHVMPILEVDEANLAYTMPSFDTDLFVFMYENILCRSVQARVRIVRGIMRHVLMGLKQIHKRGYVHMDIKAPNVVMNVRNNRVTGVAIADFGSALQEGTVIEQPEGTFGSMAPEIRGATPSNPVAVNMYADMYSVGILIIMMLMGQGQTMQLGHEQAIESAAALAPELAYIIRALTCVDPMRRPSAHLVINMLSTKN